MLDFLYQFFGFILFQIHSVIGNYGITIIVFTILVKTVLLPLNIKQSKSMRVMQSLQPEIEKLQAKYKNNPEKLQSETMKLYKLYNVNTLSGCLPTLVQLPIIMGLFGALREPTKWVFTNGGAEAVQQSFLWLHNLSDPDPYYILPILCVVLTFLTQKFTMNVQGSGSQQQTQKIMMYVTPLMIGWFAISMPAGVSLYWVVQNIYTFVQQMIVMRIPVKKISVDEAERNMAEEEKRKLKETKAMRKEQSQMRQDMMAAQMGKAPKKEKTVSRPKTKPASGKTVKRKTITKIPQNDERSQ